MAGEVMAIDKRWVGSAGWDSKLETIHNIALVIERKTKEGEDIHTLAMAVKNLVIIEREMMAAVFVKKL